MLGLMVFGGALIYLILWISVTAWAYRWAKRRGYSKNKTIGVGFAAFFLMYLIPFWDHIPTLVAHRYYCSTQAGFWVYKTPEQWVNENPGVRETLKRSLEPVKIETLEPADRYWETQRFYQEITRLKVFHAVGKTEKKFFDAKSGELIAHSINFFKGQSGNVMSLGGTPDQIRQAFILGWGNRQCGDEGKSSTDIFDQFTYQFWKWGEGK